MAVTIVRSIWQDDDGSGTVGTVINQALHTTLYNEIDTALAKVAQLAGGNTFTGTQTLTVLASATALQFFTNGPERMRLTASGELCLGATVSVGASQLFVGSDPAQHSVVYGAQNLSTSNVIFFMAFYNSTGATAGYINQTGATTVNYSTSSDQRLKMDRGRASDLAGLRAVVVHDFTWKADGQLSRGIFAQEAYAVFPRAIGPGTDEVTADGYLARPWMTDYSKFVPDLIVGWQQHDADLAELRAILAAVKG